VESALIVREQLGLLVYIHFCVCLLGFLCFILFNFFFVFVAFILNSSMQRPVKLGTYVALGHRTLSLLQCVHTCEYLCM
jgi:hypothetical protein